MTDRVYPSAKPPAATAAAGTANPAFPATKSQLYGASRQTYRSQPKRHRYRRSCCCSCCLWLTLIIIILLFLAAIASAVMYVLYRPHRPTFTVDSLKISYINITSASKINSKLNLTITARNPNKKLIYIYDPIHISIFTNHINIGEGSFNSFVHGTKNTTTLKSSISGNNQELDSQSVTTLKSDLKNKIGFPLTMTLETKVKVKMGEIRSPKVRIRVSCDGIKATVPSGKTVTAAATTANAKCKLKMRIKIWKWTF